MELNEFINSGLQVGDLVCSSHTKNTEIKGFYYLDEYSRTELCKSLGELLEKYYKNPRDICHDNDYKEPAMGIKFSDTCVWYRFIDFIIERKVSEDSIILI